MQRSEFPPLRQAWYALSVLVLAYIFSFVDRTILTLMVDPIRRSLQISDVQISLLHGFAFAIFYTVLGIPIARMADRRSRIGIITVGVVIWSAMTALCGTAKGFTQLFLARIGVGVGEAALSPAAYSMLADYFPPTRLTQALSIYTASAYLGGGLALIAGGTLIAMVPPMTVPIIGHVEPWQAVFFIVGLPGLLVALLLRTVREPARLGVPADRRPGDGVPLRDVFRHIADRRGAYGLLIGSVIAHSLMWNGVVAWVPTFMIRTFGLSPGTVGLWAGISLAVGGSAGIVAGGTVSAWLRRRGRQDANHIVLLFASVLAVPFGCTMTLVDSPALSIPLYFLFLLCTSSPYGGIVAALQEISPNQIRAQVSALYQLGLNLAGIGLGPTVVALMTEHLFGGDMGLRYAIAVIVAIGAPIAGLLAWFARDPHGRALTNITPLHNG